MVYRYTVGDGFIIIIIIIIIIVSGVDQYSVVGIGTRYGLESQGIESRWGRDLCTFPGGGANYQPSSSAKGKEIVDLYRYSLSGPSWSFVGRNLPFITSGA